MPACSLLQVNSRQRLQRSRSRSSSKNRFSRRLRQCLRLSYCTRRDRRRRAQQGKQTSSRNRSSCRQSRRLNKTGNGGSLGQRCVLMSRPRCQLLCRSWRLCPSRRPCCQLSTRRCTFSNGPMLQTAQLWPPHSMSMPSSDSRRRSAPRMQRRCLQRVPARRLISMQ